MIENENEKEKKRAENSPDNRATDNWAVFKLCTYLPK